MPQVVRGRGNGAKTQEQGSQETWEIPYLPVHQIPAGDPEDTTPGPARGLPLLRERLGGHEIAAGNHGSGWRINKPKDMRCGKS